MKLGEIDDIGCDTFGTMYSMGTDENDGTTFPAIMAFPIRVSNGLVVVEGWTKLTALGDAGDDKVQVHGDTVAAVDIISLKKINSKPID